MNFWQLLKHPRLSRLLLVRWIGQATDGIFQGALATFVLFSPERQANALNAALAFAVVLLPYSIIGPFVGTVLDRVSRQRALVISNFSRALDLLLIALLVFTGNTGLELTIFVLIAFGINRLILAATSAGLPLLVDQPNLISANAMAVTGGSVFLVLGGGLGLGLRKLFDSLGTADHVDAYLIMAAACGYALASAMAMRLRKLEIGPLDHERKPASLTQGFIEMREGWDFLKIHSDAMRGIIANGLQRGGLTALTLVGLMLERNTFNDPAKPEAGLSGLALAFSIAGIGIVVGALIAPFGVKRYGRHSWMRKMMYLSVLGPLPLAIWGTEITLFLAAFLTSLFGQSFKVTNDALVQSKIDDYYRGRVFAVYDVLVNAAIVSGGIIAALLLSDSGKGWQVPTLVSLIYFVTATRLLRSGKFLPPSK
ncbi:2A0121, H+ Antiporter protein [Candidatus Nanopelagicaceae bacterium]|jgi:MFS family permease